MKNSKFTVFQDAVTPISAIILIATLGALAYSDPIRLSDFSSQGHIHTQQSFEQPTNVLFQNPIGVDLSLNIVIKYLILILDAPLLHTELVNNGSDELEINAKSLISGYPVFGVQSGMSELDIEESLTNAYSVLVILDTYSSSLGLDQATQDDLALTVQEIIEELENGE